MEHKARHIPDYKDIIEEENGEEGGAEVCQRKNMKSWYGYSIQARATSGTCFHFLVKNDYFLWAG